jgi:hypothetical protein
MCSAAFAALLGLVAASPGEAKEHSTFRVDAEANPKNGPAFSTSNLELLKKDWPKRK